MAIKNLLVIEPAEPVGQGVRDMFACEDYHADWAGSKEVALDKLAENRYDAILLDFRLPHENNPYTVFREIYRVVKGSGCPIIIITEIADEKLADSLLHEGASHYLVRDENLSARMLKITIAYAMRNQEMLARLSDMNRELRKKEAAKDEKLRDVHTRMNTLTSVDQLAGKFESYTEQQQQNWNKHQELHTQQIALIQRNTQDIAVLGTQQVNLKEKTEALSAADLAMQANCTEVQKSIDKKLSAKKGAGYYTLIVMIIVGLLSFGSAILAAVIGLVQIQIGG